MQNDLLLDMTKLVFIVATPQDSQVFRNVFDASDQKSKIYYKCMDELPPATFRKIKFENTKKGVIRCDWVSKVTNRAPEMIVVIFNAVDELLENEKWEDRLIVMLKKLNKVYQILKTNAKEDIVLLKIIVIVAKTYNGPPINVNEKIFAFLKFYEKDLQIFPVDLVAKQLTKCRGNWLPQLQKNYELKYRKIQKRVKDSLHEQMIGKQMKLALLSELVSKIDSKERYSEVYANIKFRFTEIQRKQFNLQRYLQIRENRIVADFTLLRTIKLRLILPKDLPDRINAHMDCFKMRNMDPKLTSPFFYYQELLWRATFLDQLLEILYLTDIVELISRSHLAELINGLLTYYHRLSNISPQVLADLPGVYVEEGQPKYVGRFGFDDSLPVDNVIRSSLGKLVEQRRDYATKGAQVISRFKNAALFGVNVVNFFNIYLIRFNLSEGKFSALVSIYREIVKVELKRSNYFLLNQLFNEIQDQLPKVKDTSKVSLYGIAALICDFFKNKDQLEKYLQLFLQSLSELKPEEDNDNEIMRQVIMAVKQELAFDLKRNSQILSIEVHIAEQVVAFEDRIKMQFQIDLHRCLLNNAIWNQFQLTVVMNHPGMAVSIPIRIDPFQMGMRKEVTFEPIKYVTKDYLFKIESVTLGIKGSTASWRLRGDQLLYKKANSAYFQSRLKQPKITVTDVRKIYFLNQIDRIRIQVEKIEGCDQVSTLQIKEEQTDGEARTEVFQILEERLNLINSNYSVKLKCDNLFWIKVNKLGQRTLKLIFRTQVERRVKLDENENEISLKANYQIEKIISFSAQNVLTASFKFKEIDSGVQLSQIRIPINKRIMITFLMKPNCDLKIHEIGQQNSLKKIKYLRNIKAGAFQVASSERLQYSALFQIGEDCLKDVDLFLTKLYVKWSRPDAKHTFQNLFTSDQIKISPKQDKIALKITHPSEIYRKQKFSLSLKIDNLGSANVEVTASIESTELMLRIGQKSKGQTILPFERSCLQFDVIAIQPGVYRLPPILLSVDGIEHPTAYLNNYLIYVV